MPAQKDLKKIIRARMEKTGEAYTAARMHVVARKPEAAPAKAAPAHDYAKLAGMSDEAVKRATGRDWTEWVAVLDAANSREKPHREIATYVHSLGTPDWWSQMVTVGYERVRGLRDMGQRRAGAYEASKSRTFPVPLATLFEAVANARKRARWLDVKLNVRTVNAKSNSIRGTLDDGTAVQFYFVDKGKEKSSVAIQHVKLADKAAIERSKQEWTDRLDALAKVLK
jgi:hypothetical protein